MRFESGRCRWTTRPLGLLLAVGLALAPSAAFAADRVALVVGNSAYAAIGALPNPGNDATDVAAALGRLGFDVTPVRDADRAGLSEALRVFTRKSAGAEVSLVFYAGHGLEMDGVNYLVPVDAQLERDTDVRFEAVELDDVLAATTGAGLRIVILDACRNNPLARSMQRTGASRNVSRGSFGELNESLLGDETLVAYAAAAGTTAADGTGRNSPYTSALLSYLEQPLEIGLLFREVRARVLEATEGRQRPHEYASLLGEHYLGRAPSAAPAGATEMVVDGATAVVRLQQENLFWESIRESPNPADFDEYLRQFPGGLYRVLATNRLATLRSAAASDPPASSEKAPDAGALSAFQDCPSCPEMVALPEGTFALSKHEITRGQFAAFVAATGYDTPGGCAGWGRGSWRDKDWQNDDHPVLCVNWDDAQAYARWLTRETGKRYRLPTASEWVYAARGGETTPSLWDDVTDLEYANSWESDDGWERTAPVGSFTANGFGLHDMLGNVWEWVEDCGLSDCGDRMLLGGAWQYSSLGLLGVPAGAIGFPARARLVEVGFRVARTAD